MEIVTPDDCGNSPRLAMVRDFTLAWASGDESAAGFLHDSAVWTSAGSTVTHDGNDGLSATRPTDPPTRVTIHTVINHGKVASSDGVVESGARRLHFSHVLKFSGASKTAKITEIHSYFVSE
ncbi:MAG: hypothetical protein ACTJFR_02595 [Canibacter sp.]